jgi:deazaflavin-dependent oxidoreductase (nitroreductase family)
VAANPAVLRFVRRAFHYFNRFMLLMWRLGLGPYLSVWPAGFGRYMVITHIGRKSGLQRRTPVNYVEIGGAIYCTAGFGKVSDLYRNIQAHPQIEVWLPGGWWTATAEGITGTDGWLDLLRAVLKSSGFASFSAGINPYRVSDGQLAQVAAEYRLLHIERLAARTGEGGPGELAWVWPLLSLLLLPRALRRRR